MLLTEIITRLSWGGLPLTGNPARQLSRYRDTRCMSSVAERYEPRYCAVCGDLMPAGVHGRLKTYCSDRCQKRAERARKAARAGLPDWHPSLKAARAPAPPVPAPERQDQRWRPGASALAPQGPQRSIEPHRSSERHPEPPRPAASPVPRARCGPVPGVRQGREAVPAARVHRDRPPRGRDGGAVQSSPRPGVGGMARAVQDARDHASLTRQGRGDSTRHPLSRRRPGRRRPRPRSRYARLCRRQRRAQPRGGRQRAAGGARPSMRRPVDDVLGGDLQAAAGGLPAQLGEVVTGLLVVGGHTRPDGTPGGHKQSLRAQKHLPGQDGQVSEPPWTTGRLKQREHFWTASCACRGSPRWS